jgi:OOP family OmpA-OmpF porin
MRRALRKAADAAAAVVTLTACAACQGWVPDELDSRCGWMATTPASGSAGRTALLIDVSASTRSARESGAPDYAALLRSQIEAAVQRGDTVSIARFDGSATSVRWNESEFVTDAHRQNSTRSKREREQATLCLVEKVRHSAAVGPSQHGTDVLGAVDIAVQHLPAAPVRRTIVVATDGLPTTGCADLTRAPIGADSEIEVIADLCVRRAELARGLDGVALYFAGIGHPAIDHPQPGTQKLRWLGRLWTTLCVRTGATCKVSVDSVPMAQASTGPSAPGFTDPTVPFSRERGGVAGPADPTVIDLPEAALFDTDSWRLRPEGLRTLRRVAADLRTTPGSTVEVHAYTDSRGSIEHNRRLSCRRAKAVAAVLRAGGLKTVKAEGHGEKGLLCLDEWHPDGTENHEALQCNRRVRLIGIKPQV